jgi:transcriptional regulator with XRE-family HTH domain
MVRKKSERIAEKLQSIRIDLGLSQRGLIRAMGLEGELSQGEISMFESGKRIPSLYVLRKYAILRGTWIDYIVDDELEFK